MGTGPSKPLLVFFDLNYRIHSLFKTDEDVLQRVCLKVHIQENTWYSYMSSSFCYIDSIKRTYYSCKVLVYDPETHVFWFRGRWIASGHFENISNWNSDLWRYASSFIIHTNLHVNINLCIQTFKAQFSKSLDMARWLHCPTPTVGVGLCFPIWDWDKFMSAIHFPL